MGGHTPAESELQRERAAAVRGRGRPAAPVARQRRPAPRVQHALSSHRPSYISVRSPPPVAWPAAARRRGTRVDGSAGAGQDKAPQARECAPTAIRTWLPGKPARFRARAPIRAISETTMARRAPNGKCAAGSRAAVPGTRYVHFGSWTGTIPSRRRHGPHRRLLHADGGQRMIGITHATRDFLYPCDW